MSSFAVTLESKPPPEGILMMLDDRPEAEEIALELCRRGHAVRVLEISLDRQAQEA